MRFVVLVIINNEKSISYTSHEECGLPVILRLQIVAERSISDWTPAPKNHLRKYIFQDELSSCSSMLILLILVSNNQDPRFEYLLFTRNPQPLQKFSHMILRF